MAITHHTDVEEANSSDTTITPRRHSKLFWWLVIGIPASVVLTPLLFILALTVMFKSATPNTVPASIGGTNLTPASSTPAPAVSPAAATPTTLAPPVLPTENESDSPQTVVQNLDGHGGIYEHMMQTDDPAYLLHYYPSSDSSGYAAVLKNINNKVTLTTETATFIGLVTSSVGTFTAYVDTHADNFNVHHYIITFSWNTSTNEWNEMKTVNA